jgi:hypothetical protein
LPKKAQRNQLARESCCFVVTSLPIFGSDTLVANLAGRTAGRFVAYFETLRLESDPRDKSGGRR